jgi:hypothetical protein
MPGSQMGENQFQTEWLDQQTQMFESLRNYSYCWLTTIRMPSHGHKRTE